jgi:peptide deformylase
MKTQDTSLSKYEERLLSLLPKFPTMDKGSQDRLRKEIDRQRIKSPAFEEAFAGTLSGIANRPRRAGVATILRNFADVVTHPVREVKGVIGSKLLKRRNKPVELLVHPHPVLSAVAEPWDFHRENKEDLVEIVRKLGATLRTVDYGDKLGMAAPQIGISKRVFVCQGAVCINPSFMPPKVGEMIEVLEGCYSIPQKQIWKTKRHKYGWGKWYSIDGTFREFKLKGLDAIVFQHELDHLDGKCCCDIGVLYTPSEHFKRMMPNSIILDEAVEKK